MINVHILGNGTPVYAIKSLLELNLEQFSRPIKVTCFGDHFLNSVFVRKLNQYPSIKDIIRSADVVICTEPEYELLGIVDSCQEYDKPLFCRFLLENRVPEVGTILDGLNVENAATDLWINRLVDVTENLLEIKHFIGLHKLHDTGDNALPGISIEEYRDATQHVTGQPSIVKIDKNYFYRSEIDESLIDEVKVSTNWICDTESIDAMKFDSQSEFIFHTTRVVEDKKLNSKVMKHSHLHLPSRRSISAWQYANTCVLASFVHMYIEGRISNGCRDYADIDHDLFTKNLFGSIFRIS